MKRRILLLVAFAAISFSSFAAVAGLTNQSMANMQENYWGFQGQFGTTFSASDENGTNSGYDNIPFSIIYRQNMSITLPDGYTEKSNGNFSDVGGSKQYAIVSNPKNLNSNFAEITDIDYMGQNLNRLVMHNVAVGSDILKFTIKNFDIEFDNDITFNIVIDEVSDNGGGSAKYALFLGDDNLGEVEVVKGVQMNYLNVTIGKSKLSSKFTLSLRRIDANPEADNFILAFSEVLMTGNAKVVSGISIAIKDDEGVFLGNKVTIVASVAAEIEDNDVYWESKGATDASWTELNYRGLELVDAPKQAGITLYRAKYKNEDNDWVYSNEVSVTRIQACDGKLSNQLFFEDFGTLENEKAHATCAEVPYTFMATCKPLKNGGEYAVVANPKWAGCTKNGFGESDACREDAEHYWFRDDLRSVGGDTNGGMLMLNCNNGGEDDILYKRDVTVNCPNTTVTFSFFVAQASKSAEDPIKFQVQLVAGGNIIAMEEYDSGTLTKEDGWKAGSMQFNTGTNTKFEIRVVNYAAAGGKGNDLLFDNFAFSICTTEVSLDKAAESEGTVVGKRVIAECGTEVTLQADASTAGITKPFFLWVVKEGSSDFEPDGQISGENKDKNSFTPTADTKYATYVILAQDEATAYGYYRGEDVGCSPVSVTDTMSVLCSIPDLLYSRVCDEITLEASINPGDVVTWFKSEDGGQNWTQIGQQTASSKEISLKKVVTIIKDTKFKIETVGEGAVKSEAQTEVVKYYNIKFTVTNTDVAVVPSTTETTISKWGCAYFYPQYTGIEPLQGTTITILKGGESAGEMDMTDMYKAICQIEKAGSYYIEYDGCRSNDATVNLMGNVDIEQVSRDCNSVTFKATTAEQYVQWYYVDDYTGEPVKVGSPLPSSSTFTYTVAEGANTIEASIGSGQTIVYSDPLSVPIYYLTMKGLYNQQSYTEGQTINADYDSEVILDITPDSYVGEGKVQYYTSDGTLVFEKEQDRSALGVSAEYKFNAKESKEYYVKINGCQSGAIKVVINPEVSFESSNVCSHYTFKAEVKGEGTIKWYFDDLSQNPVEIPGTAGKLEIEYDATADGVIEARYGDAASQDEVFYHTITLAADKQQIEKGDDVTFTVTPNSADWLSNTYTSLYKGAGTKVGNQLQSESPSWTLQPLQSATYYALTEDGCRSNDVKVRVGSVSIESSNKCNTYTLKATIEGEGDLVWQKLDGPATVAANWVEIPGTAGKTEITLDVTEDITVRAKYGESYSEEITLKYYSLKFEAYPAKIEMCGDEAILTAKMEPRGIYVYSFYRDGDTGPIYEGADNSCSTGALYSTTTFVVNVNGCQAKTTVDVSLVWPTIFTPYTYGSTNSVFEVCAKNLKIFDRTGNMMADINGNSWDGYCTTGPSAGNMAMPGVYFYVATLEDGSIYKGTVELYKQTGTNSKK